MSEAKFCTLINILKSQLYCVSVDHSYEPWVNYRAGYTVLGSWEWLQSMEHSSEPVMTVIILVRWGRKWRKMSTQVLLIKQKLCVVLHWKMYKRWMTSLRVRESEVWFESPLGIFVFKYSDVYIDGTERAFSEFNNQPNPFPYYSFKTAQSVRFKIFGKISLVKQGLENYIVFAF